MAASTCTICFILGMGFYSEFHAVQGVRIRPEKRTVSSNTTAVEVILPCLYTTSNPNSVKIEWYKNHSGRNKPVMRVNTLGIITAGDNYTCRVGKGDSASLILRKPNEKDSGIYKCEVSVIADEPNFGIGIVNLTVKHDDGQRNGPCGKSSNKRPQHGGSLTIIGYIWLVPLMFGAIVMAVGMKRLGLPAHQEGSMGRQLFPRNVYIDCIVLSTPMGLCVVSVICIVLYATMGRWSESTNSYQSVAYVGFVCGALGLTGFVGIVLGYIILKESIGADGSSNMEAQQALMPNKVHKQTQGAQADARGTSRRSVSSRYSNKYERFQRNDGRRWTT